jgi:hypothetical protein
VPTWPTDLPQEILVDGYEEALPDNLIKDDLGDPAMLRRRSTAGPFPLTGSMAVTTDEWETLKAFFATDLIDGVLSFEFPPQACPVGVTSWTARFTEPPSRVYMDEALWRVTLSLEVLAVT